MSELELAMLFIGLLAGGVTGFVVGFICADAYNRWGPPE